MFQLIKKSETLSKQEDKKLTGEDDERDRANTDHSSSQAEKKQQIKHQQEDHKLSLEERKQVMQIAKDAAAMQLKKDEHEMEIAKKLANKPAASSSSKK